MSFDKFYNKYGINKIINFIKPDVFIRASSFIFPSNSVFYWFKCSDGVERIDTQYPYLAKTNKAKIITVVTYGKNTEGEIISYNKEKINLAFKNISNREKKFKFLKPDSVINSDKEIIIFNYGLLNNLYDYSYNTLNRLYKFNNTFNRMLEDLKMINNKSRYILVDLPDKLPSFNEMESMSEALGVSRLNNMPNNKYLMLLEIWKYLNPKLKNNSLFNKIKTEKLKNTTLILTIDDKMVLLNMYYLHSLIEDYKDSRYHVNTEALDILNSLYYPELGLEAIESYVNFNSLEVRKLFYILLTQILKYKPKEFKTVDNTLINEINHANMMNAAISSSGVTLDSKAIIEDILNEDNNIIDLNSDDDFDIDEDYDLSSVDIQEAIIKSGTEKTYESIEELKNAKPTEELKIKMANEIENLFKSGVINKATYKKYMEALEKQGDIENPYITSANDPIQTLSDVLDYNLDDLEINDTDKTLTSLPIMFDESDNEDTIGAMDRKYIREKYRKDIVRSVCGIRNNGNVILDYEIEEVSDITGTLEKHKITVLNLSGKKFEIRMVLPVIDDDGTYTIYGNTYILRKQRSEAPICKTDPLSVILNSYYGKIFISKANGNENVGKWFARELNKQSNKDNNITNVIPGNISLPDIELPILYSQIGREIQGFNYGTASFIFDYKNRNQLLAIPMEELEKLEKNSVFIGIRGDKSLFMDRTNAIFEYDGKDFKELGDFFSLINMDTTKMPIEYAAIKIIKYDIPVTFLLSYYLGLENLLKMLKVKYEIHDGGKRITGDNKYGVRFKDKTLIIEAGNKLADIILSGFIPHAKTIKDLSFKNFNNKIEFSIVWNQIFLGMGSNVRYTNEIKLLENMFIDPMTLVTLRLMKEPETFPGLVVRACELLLTDKYNHPNNLQDSVIKGYERVAGMVYKNIVSALKNYENASMFSKAKFNMDEYDILRTINGDNAKVAVDDLNPIAVIKQKEDVTLLGVGGRNKDTLVKSTREMHESEIGYISEATKDSTNVGVTAYMSANPKLTNLNGTVGEVKNEELNTNNILSTPGMISPFAMNDDVKRLNFSNIHAAHVIPIKEMRVPCVITSYEAIIPIKSPDKFAVTAEEDGEVIDLTKTEITVKYKTKGVRAYKLYSWTSKIESGSCFTHTIVPNLVKGQKFLKDDTITYDNLFFEPCVFAPRRTLYKQGTMINVCLMEAPASEEDSVAICKELHDTLATTKTTVRDIIITDMSNEIANVVHIGEKVSPDTPLLTLIESTGLEDVDEETLALLQNISNKSPKAKYKGVVSKIEVFYNFEPKNASKSLQKLIKYSDDVLKSITGKTGRILNKLSIKAKPILDGQCVIRIFIESENKMGTGDKCILGSQLKCTVGEVFEYDMETESGDKIEAVFSDIAIKARITISPYLIGTTSALVKKIEDNVLKMYFG